MLMVTLAEYLEKEGKGAITQLVADSGVSKQTIWQVSSNGYSIKNYRVAQAISLATNGEVSIEELCEPEASE